MLDIYLLKNHLKHLLRDSFIGSTFWTWLTFKCSHFNDFQQWLKSFFSNVLLDLTENKGRHFGRICMCALCSK